MKYTLHLSAIAYAALVLFGLFSLNAFGEEYDRIGGYSLDAFSNDIQRMQQQEQQREYDRAREYDRQFRDAEQARRDREVNERLQRLEERQP